MELSDNDIALIERYLQGDMVSDEHAAFAALVQADPALAAEVELFRDLIGGTQKAGREALKKSLIGIEAGLVGVGAFSEYEPSKKLPKPKGKSGSVASPIIKLLVLVALAAGAYMYYIGELKVEFLDKYLKKVIQIDTIITHDTIWIEGSIPQGVLHPTAKQDYGDNLPASTPTQPSIPLEEAAGESTERSSTQFITHDEANLDTKNELEAAVLERIRAEKERLSEIQ